MTREEQIRFCKICKNQKFDMNQGIICSLTNRPADFEKNCNSFIEDLELKLKVESTKIENEIHNEGANKKERANKDMLYGALWCIGGIVITAVTYAGASGGGTYVVAWGAILFGAVQFIKGLINSSS